MCSSEILTSSVVCLLTNIVCVYMLVPDIMGSHVCKYMNVAIAM